MQMAVSQMYVGHAIRLRPVSTYLLNRESYCPLELSHRVENPIDHFVMCRKHSRSRRDAFRCARERQGLGVTTFKNGRVRCGIVQAREVVW